ncbi:hypothetical protein NHQ30_008498 [Ciborinia camelliae]|nr:hypothetical protein NHQ30_008498 [Ciborinia camelliae]
MQFSTIAIISAFAAAVSATGNHSVSATASDPVVWVTDIVTQYTTFCPAATALEYNGITYTAKANETITITNCPCTVSKPVYTTSVVECNGCSANPTAPAGTAPAGSAPVYGNSTAPAPTSAASTNQGGSVGTTSAPVGPSPTSAAATAGITATNNGNRAIAFSGASLAGLLAVAAYIL